MWTDGSGKANHIPSPNYDSTIMYSDPNMSSRVSDMIMDLPMRHSSASLFDPTRMSGEGSPVNMSPWNITSLYKSEDTLPQNCLICSLVREEGHIYSLAASGDLLYTGSDSKNIRVWKNLEEFSGFKSNSGLVKTIIISGDKIFTGHQDGKIRVWKPSTKNPSIHKRSGTLPTLKDIFKSSIYPSNYVEVRKNRTALWIKHSDAVSCLSLSEDKTFLYSSSWDQTLKVWRVSDSKCIESVRVHNDAVNSVSATINGIVFTGSADGTVKAWRRGVVGKITKHEHVKTLLKQDCAVTAVVVNPTGSVVFSGSSNGVVNFWECNNNFSPGGVLKGHKLAVLCLAAAGSVVFSGSADKTICVWKREGMNYTCASVLSGHGGPVKCLAVEEDKEKSRSGDLRWIVYSGSLDKSVKVWSVAERSPDLFRGGRMQQQHIIMGCDHVDMGSSQEGCQLSSDGKSGVNRRY